MVNGLVFTPKYRRKVIHYQLRADIQKIIKDLFREQEKEDQFMDKLKTKK